MISTATLKNAVTAVFTNFGIAYEVMSAFSRLVQVRYVEFGSCAPQA